MTAVLSFPPVPVMRAGVSLTCMLRAFPPMKVSSASTWPDSFSIEPMLECKPDPVIHEPRGFLSDTDGPVNFIRTDAVLAVHNLPHAVSHFVETELANPP